MAGTFSLVYKVAGATTAKDLVRVSAGAASTDPYAPSAPALHIMSVQVVGEDTNTSYAPISLHYASDAGTGGTTITAVDMEGGGAVFTGTAKGEATAITLTSTIDRLGTDLAVGYEFPGEAGQPIIVRPGQHFVVRLDGTVTSTDLTVTLRIKQ